MCLPTVEVFAAIESAAELRWMLDHADLTQPGPRLWTRYEAALLEHWADLLRGDGEHVRLADGLTGFADDCVHAVNQVAEHDEPG